LETHGQRFTRPETIAHLRQRGAAPGFANAQHELNLSTSAISTYMSQLEAALGLVLCHRGRAGSA
jgi:DNA-binding transcriptional LysR family regulator